MKDKPGFSLIEVMITVAVTSLVMLGFAQLVNFNMKAQKGVQDASDLNVFGTLLQQVLSVPTVCEANMTANLGVGGPVKLKVTGAFPQAGLQATNIEIDYPMPAPSSLPGFVPNPNAKLVKADWDFKGWHVIPELDSTTHTAPDTSKGIGLNVKGKSSDTLYFVDVIVNFEKKRDAQGNLQSMGGQTGQRQVSTILVSTSSPDVNGFVTIQGCGSVSSQGRTSCPSDYSLVGTAGDLSAYCISTQRQTAADADVALGNCLSQSIQARLCTPDEWNVACRTRTTLSPPITQVMAGAGSAAEWLSMGPSNGGQRGQYVTTSSYPSAPAGPANCRTFGEAYIDSYSVYGSLPYRCCLH